TPLPDRRAFAVAAALAELPSGECVFVSRDIRLRLAAAAAGMRTVVLDPVPAPAPRPRAGGPGLLAGRDEGAVVVSPPALLAGEVDEDTGPTFVLEGRVVTMDDALGVIDHGRVLVRKGKLIEVGPAADPLPPDFANAKRVDTKGTIYPGLI